MKNTKIGLVAALASAAAACFLAAAPANAEPVPAGDRPLAGVGSDTIQDVMNALSNGNNLSISGVRQVASFNAFGSSPVVTKTGCSLATRPNGSGAGRTALLTSLQANAGAGDGCVDFARSSSLTLTASTPSLTYVPFAVDAVSYVVTNTSAVSRSLTTAELNSYYHCDPGFVGTGPNFDVRPVLPQAGSGTRSYWLGKVGLTEADITAGINTTLACLVNGSYNSQVVEEHTSNFMTDAMIVPFSIGQYNAQATQLIADKRGRGVLGKIDNTIPQLTNSSFAFNRDVYNVIPTSKIATAPWSTVFVGSGSLMCSTASQAVVAQYGFGALSGSGAHVCGDTSQHS